MLLVEFLLGQNGLGALGHFARLLIVIQPAVAFTRLGILLPGWMDMPQKWNFFEREIQTRFNSKWRIIRNRFWPSEGDLGGHDPLALDDQQAIGALALLPSAEFLVSFEAGDDAVIATAGALWRPQQPLLTSTTTTGLGHLLDTETQRTSTTTTTTVHDDPHGESRETLNSFSQDPPSSYFSSQPEKNSKVVGSFLFSCVVLSLSNEVYLARSALIGCWAALSSKEERLLSVCSLAKRTRVRVYFTQDTRHIDVPLMLAAAASYSASRLFFLLFSCE